MLSKALKAGKNLVLQTPEIEQKVLEATSNEQWGPTGTQMKEIARATNSYNDFAIIMNCIWKRLNDRGKLWRHVYKSLLLLEYLVKNGSDQCVREARVHIIEVQTLQQFQHIDEKDHDVGLSVRERAKQIVDLLNDENKIRAEREKAQKVSDKFNTFMSSEGGGYAPRNYSSSSSSSYGGSGGGGYNNNNTSPRDDHGGGGGRTYTAPAGAVRGTAADDDDDLPVPQPLPGSPRYGQHQVASPSHSQYQHQPSQYQPQQTGYQNQQTGYQNQQTGYQNQQSGGSFYQQAPQQQAQQPNQAQIFSLLMDQPQQQRPAAVPNPPQTIYQPQVTGGAQWGQPVQQQPQAQLTGAGQYRPPQAQQQQSQTFNAQWPQPVQQQEDFFNPRSGAAAQPAPVLTPSNTAAAGTEWADFAGYSGGVQQQQHQQQQTQQPAGPADPWSAGSKLYNLDLDKKQGGATGAGHSSPQAPTLGALKQQHNPYAPITPSSPAASVYSPQPTASVSAAPSTAPIYVAGPGGQPTAYVLTPGPGGAYVLAPAPTGFAATTTAPAANPFGQPIRP